MVQMRHRHEKVITQRERTSCKRKRERMIKLQHHIGQLI